MRKKNEGPLPFVKILRSPSTCKHIEVVFHLKKNEVVFQMESAQLVEQVLQTKFCRKKLF